MLKKTLKEFKEFAVRGNAVEMAVGISMGVAFGRVINSLVNDILMPPIGKLVGRVDFSSLYINLSSTPYASLAEAKKAGAPTINYGIFVNDDNQLFHHGRGHLSGHQAVESTTGSLEAFGKGRNLVGQLGQFAAEAPVPKLREELGYGF